MRVQEEIGRSALALALVAIVGLLTAGGGAAAHPLHYRNPLRAANGQPITCPDPSVTTDPHGAFRFVLVCTSDNARDAFPIWRSHDLVHWRADGYVFPRRHQPWWAVPASGRGQQGIYWGPEIYHINRRWLLVFAAQYNPASHAIPFPPGHEPAPGTMMIGVATASSLAGPWRSRILHYRGQFNGLDGEQELGGGTIDPSIVRDGRTGQLYLFWAVQQHDMWAGRLSADGQTLDPHIHHLLDPTEPWECSQGKCTLEGPEPLYHDGRFYLLYSAASTWDDTYVLGAAVASRPFGPYVKRSHPVLRTGRGFLGPASSSHPVVGPDRHMYVLYHALMHMLTVKNSAARKLMLGRWSWRGFWPLVNDGRAA
jgi:beta-xylosidase